MKRNIGPKTLKQTLFLETHLQPIRGRVQGDKSPFPMMSENVSHQPLSGPGWFICIYVEPVVEN